MQQVSQYPSDIYHSPYNPIKRDEMVYNTESNELILMKLSNLVHELDIQTKAEEAGKNRLMQLHTEYNMKLRTLKEKASALKKKLQILEKYPRCQELEIALTRKKHEYHTTANAHMNLSNQKTLQQAKEEHSNLSIIARCLKNQLQSLVEQYHSQPQQQSSEKLATESNKIAHPIPSTDPMYQQVLKENRKLQRQIRFLRHVVKLESELQQKSNVHC